jgi:tetratricopeptide (TPR) repeat protein
MVGKGRDNAKDWFSKGLEFQESGKLEEAIECYDKALEINPLYEGAWGNKGTCLDSMGRYSNALKCYDKVLEINPKSHLGWYAKGNTLHKLDRHEEAIKCYDESIKINPDHYGSWNNKGNCLAILDRYEEAFICFDKAISINSSEESAWALKGTWLDRIGRPEEAIQYYDDALKINPNDANIWFKKAFCTFASNEWSSNVGKGKCASQLETALGLGLPLEDEANARALLGYSYERLEKYSDAKRELEKAKEIDDQSDNEILSEDLRKEVVHTSLAFCYAIDARSLREEGNVDEAIKVANQVIQLDNSCDAAHIVLAECYLNQKKWNSVIAEYKKVDIDKLTPDLVIIIHENLGLSYKETENIDFAIVEFEKVLNINGMAEGNLLEQSKLPPILNALSQCYAMKSASLNEEGKLEEAITAAKKSIQIFESSNAGHLALAQCYMNSESWELAISEYNKVSVDDLPSDVAFTFHNNFGVAYVSQGNIDLGIRELEKALEINPNASKARELLSMAISERSDSISEEDIKEAEEPFEKATVPISGDVYKGVNILKAELSAKKGKTLTWDEFFELLLSKERKKKDLTSWLYTFGIFFGITFILMFPLYIGAPLAAMAMMPVFILIGFIVAFFSAYVLIPWTLRGIKPFENAPPEILKSLEELSKKARIKNHPELMIAETAEINAMAYTSVSGDRVCVTRGLVGAYQSGKIEEEELNAILGHEIGHIRNLDCFKWSFVLSWISIFDAIGTVCMHIGEGILHLGVILSEATEETVIVKEGRDRYVARREGGMVGLLIALFGWILYMSGIIQKIFAKLASILAFHLSRKLEYAADAMGAELTSPENMANALRKINTIDNELVAKELAALPYADRWQLQPRNPSWIDKLFDTHPPTEDRYSTLSKLREFL